MRYDVIVIGGGHAGCEAAAAAARAGAEVLLLTAGSDSIGAMSCNPAIGGVGKGHLVRELDVFDGLMARAADAAAIHYRMLNRSKGSAVHGPRIQADRARYRTAIQGLLAQQQRLTIRYGWAEGLLIDGGVAAGVILRDGSRIWAATVILATGTFLGGRLFRGTEREEGGRIGEPAATMLSRQLRDRGLPVARLKTGTPPRLDGRTIDWARLERQSSDDLPWTMSPLGPGRVAPQIACGITRTNSVTHAVIRAGMDRSPLQDGAIEGRGPRYCPSIEDKVERFGDRDGHQIFLEPEGLADHLVYPNGISTSLPVDVQEEMIRSIVGLERARIVQPGYAVEYDYLDPRILQSDLQVRDLPGLFCAGQINGTTGYEEAAAQGLVAGLNAAAMSKEREPIRFDRADSYIGVMVDDLTLQGVTEPYRMLTARAEFRLRLRADNAGTRLGPKAVASQAIGRERLAWLDRRREMLAEAERLIDLPLPTDGQTSLRRQVQREMLGVAEASALLPTFAAVAEVGLEALDDARYAPYLAREAREVGRVRSDEAVSLASIGDYASLPGLSLEMIERLERTRPETLGAAGRIRGITPAALASLLLAVRRRAA